MARPRKATGTLESLQQCTEALRTMLVATTEIERLQAERDASMARLFKTYERDLARQVEIKSDLELQLQQYYMTHLKEIEKDGKKSIELTYGVMGRRLAPAALKLLNKAWTWTAALVSLRERFGDRYLRKRDPEIDKDLVKAEIPEADLANYGLQIKQEENFYIELQRPAEQQG